MPSSNQHHDRHQMAVKPPQIWDFDMSHYWILLINLIFFFFSLNVLMHITGLYKNKISEIFWQFSLNNPYFTLFELTHDSRLWKTLRAVFRVELRSRGRSNSEVVHICSQISDITFQMLCNSYAHGLEFEINIGVSLLWAILTLNLSTCFLQYINSN